MQDCNIARFLFHIFLFSAVFFLHVFRYIELLKHKSKLSEIETGSCICMYHFSQQKYTIYCNKVQFTRDYTG